MHKAFSPGDVPEKGSEQVRFLIHTNKCENGVYIPSP